MSLLIELPPDVEQELRAEAARKGQAAEELIRTLIMEHFHTPSQRAQRVAALLDQWNAEDDVHPEPGPVVVPSRIALRIPDVG